MNMLATPPAILAMSFFSASVYYSGLILSMISLGLAIIFFLDFVARLKDARLLEKTLSDGDLTGASISQMRAMRHSWCGRSAAIATLQRHGHGGAARKFYRALGYTPFSILPDGAPACFVKRSFWKGLVGL